MDLRLYPQVMDLCKHTLLLLFVNCVYSILVLAFLLFCIAACYILLLDRVPFRGTATALFILSFVTVLTKIIGVCTSDTRVWFNV